MQMFVQLRKGNFPKGFKEQLPDEAAVIIDVLLKKDPKLRLSANDLLNSEWLKSFKKKMEKGKSLYIPIIRHKV